MYQALLMAPDGDWVTDHRAETKEEVRDLVADQGSRWYFYPVTFTTTYRGVTSSRQRIVDAVEPFDHLIGRSIETASAEVRHFFEDEENAELRRMYFGN